MQFLREPALFPARIAGEPWGSRDTRLTLGGQQFVIRGLSDPQIGSLSERYASRLGITPGGEPAATIQIFHAAASDFVEIDTRGWDYSLDIQWSGSQVSIAGLRLMALIDLGQRRGAIWTPVEEASEFWGIVENVLRPLLAATLLRSRGLLVHSVAAAGILFPGASGHGKSTLARLALAAGVPVLSDDLNAVVARDGGHSLLPLPFTGDLLEHELASDPQPLRAIVALKKGSEDRLDPLSRAAAVALLVRSSPYINQDPAVTEVLMERAAELVRGIPVATLTFRVDGDVWPILRHL